MRGWQRGLRSENPQYSTEAVRRILWVWLICVMSSIAVVGQSPEEPGQPPTASAPQTTIPEPNSGSVSGTVVDQSGAVIANVRVTLVEPSLASKREALSDGDGRFLFADVISGPFQLTLTASGFATIEQSGMLRGGEDYVAPQIALVVAHAEVDVEVSESSAQVAEDEVKVEEKQRVLGVIPNFYVSYVPNAAPLTAKLKFQLAWKSIINPYTFGITGAIAGIEQADNQFSGYGQGAQGYAKRYGAAYADLVTGSLIGGAILPSLLKQDPRYFYKGTGSRKSRLLYAIATSVVCKGDNRRWQPDYSGILGGLAAGGISNFYYPAQNRSGVTLTFENALIGIAGGAAGNILQEFVVRRFTPHLPVPDSGKP